MLMPGVEYPKVEYPRLVNASILRQSPDGLPFHDPRSPKRAGEIYYEYDEVWRQFGPVPDRGQAPRERISQLPTGRVFCVTGSVEVNFLEDWPYESEAILKADLAVFDPQGAVIVRLRRIK